MGYSRRLSIVYSPWSNGPVERRNREVIRLFRSLTSEIGLPLNEWPSLLNTVMGHINNHPIKSKLNLTPNQIYSGRNIEGKILALDPDLDEPLVENNIVNPTIPIWNKKHFIQYQNTDQLTKYIKELTKELGENDKKLLEYLTMERDRHQKRYNKNIHMDYLQYGPGDYVMYSIAETSLIKDKLQLRWLGPVIIEKITGNNLYLVKDLLGNTMEVHSRRIKYYDGKGLPNNELIKEVYLYNSGRFYLEEVLDVQEIDGKIYLKVKWKALWNDVKYSIIKFLQQNKDKTSLINSLYEKYVVPHKKKNSANIVYYKSYPEKLKLEHDGVLPYLTQSKGWTDYEDYLLKRLIRGYGFGQWEKILNSNCLPGKTRSQIINRSRVLVGSQAIFLYHGLKIDLDIIKRENDRKVSPRKNGLLYNNEKHLSTEERKILKEKTYNYFKDQQDPLLEKNIGIPIWDKISQNRISYEQKKNLLEYWKNKIFMFEEKDNNQEVSISLIDAETEQGFTPIGLLDSGASVTCTSLKSLPRNNQYNIISKDEYHRAHLYLYDANNNPTMTIGYVALDVIITLGNGEIQIPKVKILITDAPKWNYFLLGNDILKKLGANPINILQNRINYYTRQLPKENKVMRIGHKTEKYNLTEQHRNLIRDLDLDINLEKKKNENLLKSLVHFYYDHYDEKNFVSQYNDVRVKAEYLGDNEFKLRTNGEDYKIWVAPKYSTYATIDILDERSYLMIKDFSFKALVVDPPWRQTRTSPTRGATVPFSCMSDEEILSIHLSKFMKDGYLFLWTVTNKLRLAYDWMEKSGFKYLDFIIWDKSTKHDNDFCSQAKIGEPGESWRRQKEADLFRAAISTPMRKPNEFYDLIENSLPGGLYLEIFGRTHNLRDRWITMGNEIDPSADKNSFPMFKLQGFDHHKKRRVYYR
eukprot:snap_masked-scaffold_45-processed-gene-1.15-mRNA-1 protein AED:0.65 eAED:0.65 QI:0/0/0/0.4/1/1/5/0/920